ncbi:glycosyltransferase family 4 protein [Leptolyngbya sp. 'hensonii']|uniref:glycosyltransferase family 4 protein n=1 Tax=Leptolyngbya sp. 'hensonii' TaxID=1922337 RepID=UPI00209B16FA|nr:glycosyltransferase family 4 protein [Leptolyngbya sp. 'hensonii']
MITQFYPPDYAATGQLIEELVSYLAKHGVHIQVFTGQPGYAFEKQSAATVEYVHQTLVRRSRTARLWPQRIRGKALNGLLFALRSVLHLFRIAPQRNILLVTTAPPYLPFLGYVANVCFGLPYLCILYDLYPDVAVELKVIEPDHGLTRLWNSMNRKVWRRAESLIVLSSTMQDRITKACPEVADKISVIHSWANPDWILPINKVDNWFAHQYNLVHKFTVLYSGNMGRCHDIETILDTITLLRDEPVQFVFIGGGAKRQSCITEVKSLGLQNCLFLPYQDKQVIPYSLTACDLSLVSIGPDMEGLIAPSKFYGSLAAGRPIAAICASHSYLRPIIADARCGATFDIGDSQGLAAFIQCLMADADLCQRMGLAGRQYLESHFTLDIIGKKYLHLLRTTAKTIAHNDYEAEMPINTNGNGNGSPHGHDRGISSTKPSLTQRLAKWPRH